MKQNKIYGSVKRFPKNENERYFTTKAYDGVDDPEGCFEYEFGDAPIKNWDLPIFTEKDLQWFKNRPEEYSVKVSTTRPGVQRPRIQQVRTKAEVKADEIPVVDKSESFYKESVSETKPLKKRGRKPGVSKSQ